MVVLYRYFARMFHGWYLWWLIFVTLKLKQGHRLTTWLYSEQAEIDRSRLGIHAFLGENGSGKTNLMMRQALRYLNSGKKVISTVPMYIDKENGVLHPLYVPFDSWTVLLTARNCVVVMDEMKGVANATESAALPNEIQLIINQCRKRKIIILWSSPAWEDAQAQVRRITRAVTICEGSWRDKDAYREMLETDPENADEAWMRNRLFHARTYRKVGTSSDFKIERHQLPDVEEWYWGPGSASFDLYDTDEETTRLMEADEAGLCMRCFGTRRRGECICHAYVEKRNERDATAKALRPAREPAPARGPGRPARTGSASGRRSSARVAPLEVETGWDWEASLEARDAHMRGEHDGPAGNEQVHSHGPSGL